MLKVQSAFIFTLLFLFLTKIASAQIRFNPTGGPLPLWEAGFGIVHAIAPDYPGADHSSTYTIPFPAALYRGDVLRADEDGGMRGRFLKKKREPKRLN